MDHRHQQPPYPLQRGQQAPTGLPRPPAFDRSYPSASNDPALLAGQKRSSDQRDDDDLAQRDSHDLDSKHDDSAATADGKGPGANSGATTPTGGKKVRNPAAPPLKRGTACTLCRRRKLRCDGVRPKCGTCLRLSHDCQYGDPAQERAQQLEERIRSLEREIESYRRGETPPDQMLRQRILSATREFAQPATSIDSNGSAQQDNSNGGFPALNMPATENAGYSPPSVSANPASQFSNYDPEANFPPHPPPHAPQHQGIDSSYLYGPDASRPPPPGHQHSFGRPDSETFPLPIPPNSAQSDNYLSRLSVPSSVNDSLSPRGAVEGENHSPIPLAGPGPNLQSFPFAMNPTPQLSDLINPQHYSPVAPPYPHHPNARVEGGSPGSLHQISPAGVGSAYHAPGYGGISLASSTLPHESPSNGHRQPFDSQSALASPERNLLSLGNHGGIPNGNGVKKEEGELATMWVTAELPDIDLMVELANLYFLTIHQHLPFLHRPRFLYTLRHPASLSSPPSLSLIFAVLAVAAAYHDSPQIRALQTRWYNAARDKVEVAIQAGVRPSGGRIASLTVEMVQALTLLALMEMGQSDHQRAFLSIGQAVRIAAMLGLHRMDEDRLSQRCGTSGDKRLRPPALHELPTDGVLLEECRRTMCAVIVIDRFEQGCVGWPSAIAEPDLRILLPCDEPLYETGTCSSDDNPMWWPSEGLEAEDQETMKEGNERKRVGTFAWLCRVAWVGGRVQLETYRASGPPAGGPWNKNIAMDPLFSTNDMLEMDKLLDFVRSKLGQLAAMKATQHKGVDGPVIMTLLLVNCLFVNLHHLRASTGLKQLPFDPTAPIFLGTAEYSLQRCWEAIHSLYEIVSQLAGYENARTSLRRSRINTFTSFIPYVLYCVAFPAKYAIGDWTALVNSRDRTENVPAHLSRIDVPRGDDVFPPSYFEQRLKMVDALCDAMERVGAVWPIGHKFATMVSGDRIRLSERTYQREQQQQQQQRANSSTEDMNPLSQPTQHLHPHHTHHSQPQTYQTSPTLPSDQGF
ncbi:uncharacterized protein JCM15063_001607 [Sporobolomyces koalae]|uniref:uncharacterized protein n=1 Tax=Sporobolomyces koalae TaxID=500713 RepID=UPI00317CD3B8